MSAREPEIVKVGDKKRLVRCEALGLSVVLYDLHDAVTVRRLMEEVLKARGEKKCARCKQKKALDEFYRMPAKKDGHQANCITCCSAISRESYQKRLNWAHGRRMQAGDYEHAA